MRKHLGKVSVGALILLLGALGKFGNDMLDMRAKWRDQQAKALADSVAVSNRLERLENTLSGNGAFDQRLARRVQSLESPPRFERPARPAASSREADSASVRSPGPIQVLSKVVTAPVGWLWRGLKAAFPPVKGNP